MQEYQEGQRLQGSDGNTYVVRNGVPVREGGQGRIIPTPQDPRQPLQIEGDRIDNTRGRIGVRTDQVQADILGRTADATVRKAEADADAARFDAQIRAQEAAQGPQISDSQRAAEQKTQGQRDKAVVVRQFMQQLDQMYRRNLEGQPASRLFGLTERVQSFPKNEEFNTTAESILPLIRPMIAQSAKEGDSDKEMQIFMSYIPNSRDNDITIERKLKNLDVLLGGLVEGRAPSQIESGGFPRDLAISQTQVQPDGGNPPSGRSGSQQPLGLANASDDRRSIPIPPAMQAEHRQYLAGLNGRPLDIGDYLRFRVGLDDKYGLSPNTDAYRDWAERANANLEQGVAIGGDIGPIDAEMDAAERLKSSLFNNELGAAALGFADSTGAIDELAAGASSLITGRDYDFELAKANATKNALRGENPGSYLTGNLLGGVTAGGALAKFAPNLARSAVKNGRRTLATGAATGATVGALDENDNRLGGALGGGILGAGGGAAGRYVVAPAVERISRSRAGQATGQMFRRARSALTGQPHEPSNVPTLGAAESMVRGNAADLRGIRQSLADAERYGLPYALADADPKLQNLAGSVSRVSQNARRQAEAIFEPRALDQATRASDAVDSYLAPITDINARKAQLTEASNIASGPLFEEARAFQGEVPQSIQSMLSTREGRKALNEGYEIAQLEGKNPETFGLRWNEPAGQAEFSSAGRYSDVPQPPSGRADGTMQDNSLPMGFDDASIPPLSAYATETPQPSFVALDYARRGIDKSLNDFRNDVTGKIDYTGNPKALALKDFRGRFVSELDRVNPKYAEARAASRPFLQAREALEMGLKGNRPRLKPRDLDRQIQGWDENQLGEYRRGYATSMADDIDDKNLTGDPYSRVFGSTSQQQKVQSLFPEGASDFRRIRELEGDMSRTRYETLGGSPTAARQQADAEFAPELAMSIVDGGVSAAATGGVLSALKNGAFRKAGDALKFGLGERARKRADMVAEMLFDSNPANAGRKLDELITADDALKARRQQFQQYGGLLGGVVIPASF